MLITLTADIFGVSLSWTFNLTWPRKDDVILPSMVAPTRHQTPFESPFNDVFGGDGYEPEGVPRGRLGSLGSL